MQAGQKLFNSGFESQMLKYYQLKILISARAAIQYKILNSFDEYCLNNYAKLIKTVPSLSFRWVFIIAQAFGRCLLSAFITATFITTNSSEY